MVDAKRPLKKTASPKTLAKKSLEKLASKTTAIKKKSVAKANSRKKKVLIGIVMGSISDWEIMKEAAQVCKDFDIPYEARALSAHRSPVELEAWIADMEQRGCQAFIAGAGGAAHLAGVVASQTILPTFGVPMPSKYMKGLDSLLATVQMPKGIPVPTMAIGEAGAANASLAVIAIMALTDPILKQKLLEFREKQSKKVIQSTLPDLK